MGEAIEWITTSHRLAELAAAWDDVLSPSSTPFDEHAWFVAWWEAFGGGSDLCVCAVWRGHRLAAIAPLLRRSALSLKGLANEHSPLFRPLAVDEAALRRAIEAILARDAAELELFGIPSDEPALAALVGEARRRGMRHVVEAAHVSPIVETVGSVDAWRAASKPRWGAPLERFRRKMARDHDCRTTLVEAPEELDGTLDRGFRVEASGWKGRAGTAILSAPETELFYRAVAHAFARRGELRVSSIELEGELVAFDLTILHSNRLHLLKTGFDERFRRLAPGLVMRLSIIERCFELGIDAHELLGADSEWKRKFSTAERGHVTFRAFAPSLTGAGYYGYRTVARPLLRRAYHRAKAIRSRQA